MLMMSKRGNAMDNENDGLTPRELECLQGAADGVSSDEISERLGISRPAVARHFSSIYRKLGISGKPGAVAVAMRRGLIT